ncbi:hypothetical protein Pmani_001031 [Petrolisthes manimaculis]|uniref:Myb/SANT-like DNA-binding domain-containing protein n=1 Tax=Petrolisthes manimaculis TaxID=1843537 RepID=A0AAE1QKG9_9EUCA|nr:hypothetical protein Pmani_001031 [Petrolisthes manimaculis]
MASQTTILRCPYCHILLNGVNSLALHLSSCTATDEKQSIVHVYEGSHTDLPDLNSAHLHHQKSSSVPEAHDSEESQPAAAAGPLASQQEHAWCYASTLLLIETYRQHEAGFSDSTKKKNKVWKEIAEVLRGRGYRVNGNFCDTKMRALRRRYKTIKNNATLSGRGAMKQWQYFYVMDDLFIKKPATQPKVVEGTDPEDSDTSRASPSSSHFKPIPSPDTLQPRPAPIHSPVSSVPSPVSPHGESSCDEHDGMQPPRKKPRPQQQLWSSELLESFTSVNKERADALSSFLATYRQQQEDDKQQLHQQQEKYLEKLEALHQSKASLMEGMVSMKNDHCLEIQTLQTKHQNDMQKLQEGHQLTVQKLQEQHRKEVWELHEKIINMQQEHQQQLVSIILRSRTNGENGWSR